jgi:hypothetical protein
MIHVDRCSSQLQAEYPFIRFTLLQGAPGVLRGAWNCNPTDPVNCKYGCTCYTSMDLASHVEQPGAIIAMQNLMFDAALLDSNNSQVWMQGTIVFSRQKKNPSTDSTYFCLLLQYDSKRLHLYKNDSQVAWGKSPTPNALRTFAATPMT